MNKKHSASIVDKVDGRGYDGIAKRRARVPCSAERTNLNTTPTFIKTTRVILLRYAKVSQISSVPSSLPREGGFINFSL